MNDSKEILFHKIEDYLKGNLSLESTKIFEAQINSDLNLKNQVEQQMLEREGLRLLAKEQIKEKMHHWEKEDGLQKDSNSIWKRLFLIFGLLLIIGLTYVYFVPLNSNKNQEPTESEVPLQPSFEKKEIPKESPLPIEKEEIPKESKIDIKNQPVAKEKIEKNNTSQEFQINQAELLAIIESNYKPDDNLLSNLKSSNSTEKESILNKGIASFKIGELDKAITDFLSIDSITSPTEYEISRVWLGHSYLSTKQYTIAIPIFEELVSTATDSNIDRMEWYLTLSLLSDYPKYKEKINILLDKMINPDMVHIYQRNAQGLKNAIAKSQ